MPLSERIKAIRLQRGLSIRELSRLVHVDHSFLSLVERGKRSLSIDVAKRIALALDVSLDYIAEMPEKK